MYSRNEILLALIDVLKNEECAIAAWEGGSAATGFVDEYSDLDLIIVSEGEDANYLFQVIDKHFELRYGIESSFRVPEPTWHKMSQCFYFLKETGDYFYCDIAIVSKSNPSKLMEQDRHGKAIVYFDKLGIYDSTPTSDHQIDQMRKRFYAIATEYEFISIRETKKALARKNWIAAHMGYLQFINRSVVILLNLKYRPQKVDFGIRYADRDYPPEEAIRLEQWLRVSSIADILAKLPEVLDVYYQLKQELLVWR